MVTLERKDVMRLAAESELDPRTVRRALESGVDALLSEVDRRRFREAARKLRLKVE